MQSSHTQSASLAASLLGEEPKDLGRRASPHQVDIHVRLVQAAHDSSDREQRVARLRQRGPHRVQSETAIQVGQAY